MQNNKTKTIYSEEKFKDLINALKDIKEKTSKEKDSGNNYQQKIYDTLNELENIYDYKPSYKNFINKMITQESIDDAKNEIIKDLKDKNMNGYTPELKILMEKIASKENIELTKEYYIEEFKTLNIK